MKKTFPIPSGETNSLFRKFFLELSGESPLAAFSSQGFAAKVPNSPFLPPLVDWLIAWEPIEVRHPPAQLGVLGFAPMDANHAWVGLFHYDAGMARWPHKLPLSAQPGGFFFRPRHVLYASQGLVVYEGPNPQWIEKIQSNFSKDGSQMPTYQPPTKVNAFWAFDRNLYLKKAKELLHQMDVGEVYELNFCNKLTLDLPYCTDWGNLWLNWTAQQPMPFSAFLNTPDEVVMSVSPERFLSFKQENWFSQPMKGTAPRKSNPIEDLAAAQLLEEDPKERSENIMIVDLVRHDFSQIAQPGTVKVRDLCKAIAFPGVHQMISTLQAKARPEFQWWEVVDALFPMGSMTGAPKLRAMQLIHESEEGFRGAFSGSAGYWIPGLGADFNVLIRTLLHHPNQGTRLWVGSALTRKCHPHQEWEELGWKTALLKKWLNLTVHEHVDNFL